MYDYLVVGAGLFGAVFAYEANRNGKSCLVIDKREHIGGNIYTECIEKINVHRYGAHIFHTDNKYIWDYINKFAEFNNFINSPLAVYKDRTYNLPFNMNTFSKMWEINTPDEARKIIERQIKACHITNAENLEEKALSLVGSDIYEILIKGYTTKQWGRECKELPAEIIERIPIRYTYDNNYFNDRYQGIPIGGYTAIIEKMLLGIEVLTKTNYISMRKQGKIAKKIIYTGMIDEFYDYKFGALEYRSLRFEDEILECENYQGNAVVNYTDKDILYTRILEHKHFERVHSRKTIITKEYPFEWKSGFEPFYPVNDEKNNQLYKKYKLLASKERDIFFCGRLGEYKYYNMDNIVAKALEFVKNEFKQT